MDYSNRTYAFVNTSDIGSVDFSQVMETSANTVRKSIDDKIKEGKVKIIRKIGEGIGYKTKSGWEMDDREGVILC